MNRLKHLLFAIGIGILVLIAGFSLLMFPLLLFYTQDSVAKNIGIGYLFLFLLLTPISWIMIKKLIKVA